MRDDHLYIRGGTQEMERCATWAEAEEQHERYVAQFAAHARN